MRHTPCFSVYRKTGDCGKLEINLLLQSSANIVACSHCYVHIHKLKFGAFLSPAKSYFCEFFRMKIYK